MLTNAPGTAIITGRFNQSNRIGFSPFSLASRPFLQFSQIIFRWESCEAGSGAERGPRPVVLGCGDTLDTRPGLRLALDPGPDGVRSSDGNRSSRLPGTGVFVAASPHRGRNQDDPRPDRQGCSWTEIRLGLDRAADRVRAGSSSGVWYESSSRRPARGADAREIGEIALHRRRQVPVRCAHGLSFRRLRGDAQERVGIGFLREDQIAGFLDRRTNRADRQ